MGLLIRGSVGPLVHKLQEDLTALGYVVEPDGVYGAATEEQVRSFQDTYGLEADGKAGAVTQAKIAELREEIAGMKAKENASS
jgi:peptidoglycan hydrolase-like protein with peptidoglycan-binding domain